MGSHGRQSRGGCCLHLSSAKYMHFPLSSGFLPEVPALKRWNVSPAIILRVRFSDSSGLGLSPYAPQGQLAFES